MNNCKLCNKHSYVYVETLKMHLCEDCAYDVYGNLEDNGIRKSTFGTMGSEY